MKGTWFYEFQILMFVFMWQHTKSTLAQHHKGLHLGRFVIWKDSMWLRHGVGLRLHTWYLRKILKPYLKVKSLITSFQAFLILTSAGFKISRTVLADLILYRFFWKDNIIKNMADIDCVAGKYSTMYEGSPDAMTSSAIITKEASIFKRLNGQKYDVLIKQYVENVYTVVADPNKHAIIEAIPGIEKVKYDALNNGNQYLVWFDQRYDPVYLQYAIEAALTSR